MSLPAAFAGCMRLPAIAAPMFLVSGPELVINTCTAGVAGTFPALNARTPEILDEWLGAIDAALDAQRATGAGALCAPYGVNLILHPSNPRVQPDLALLVKHRTPFVITSLGNPAPVVEVVKSYGGLVFSDVVHAYHAKKAAAAGVDGIIAVGGGAGGHAGTQNPFSCAPVRAKARASCPPPLPVRSTPPASSRLTSMPPTQTPSSPKRSISWTPRSAVPTAAGTWPSPSASRIRSCFSTRTP